MSASSSRRIPRAHIDPICSAVDAMAVFVHQLSRPLRHETLVMFLDVDRRGSTLVTVTGTLAPDSIIDIAETMALTAQAIDKIAGLVIASVRPGGSIVPGDDARWLAAAEAVDDAGLELIEWLVIGQRGTKSPREVFGLPSRWI